MDKPRYRYNNDTGKWDQVYRFSTDIVVMSGVIRPDGSHHSFKVPYDSPLADFYRKEWIAQ